MPKHKCVKCELRANKDKETESLIQDLQEALQKQNRRVTLLNEMYAELQATNKKLRSAYEDLLHGRFTRSTNRDILVQKDGGTSGQREVNKVCNCGSSCIARIN